MKYSLSRSIELFLFFGLLASSSALNAQGLTGKSFTGKSIETNALALRQDNIPDDSAVEKPLPAARKARTLAFKGGPQADCKWFLITENGFAVDLDTRLEFLVPPPLSRYSWELGLMKNVSERQAFGATFYLGYDVEDEKSFLFAFKPRFRQWFSRRFHADAAAGIIFAQAGTVESYQRADLPGFEGHVALGFADWISAGFHLEVIRIEPKVASPFTDPPETRKSWFIGLTLGSYPGAIASPISGALAGLIQFFDVND